VRLEAQGRNCASAPDPDARGVRGGGGPVVPGAPAALPCMLSLDAIGASLDRHGVRWSRSDDAGGYVCNDLYLRLLHARASHEGEGPRPAPTVFVHVPTDAHRDAALPRALAEGLVAALAAL
jgi:pyroglutamyl-peptidase